ncbi:MAG: hypothetical protein WD295_00640, partial [Bacteroidota bacterium]
MIRPLRRLTTDEPQYGIPLFMLNRFVSFLAASALFLARPGFGQIPQLPPDTLRVLPEAGTSPVTALPDTLPPERRSDIDTVVVYTAKDSVAYSMRTRFMHLYGQGDIKYRSMGIQAERIGVNWDSATMAAEGVPDSSDTTGSG